MFGPISTVTRVHFNQSEICLRHFTQLCKTYGLLPSVFPVSHGCKTACYWNYFIFEKFGHFVYLQLQ
ncbi:unnamed protein product [Rotaria magnacalcarata]